MKKIFLIILPILFNFQLCISQSSFLIKNIKNDAPKLESITFLYLSIAKCNLEDLLEIPDSLMTIRKVEYFDENNKKVKSVNWENYGKVTKEFDYLNDKLFREVRIDKDSFSEETIYTYKEMDDNVTEITKLTLDSKKINKSYKIDKLYEKVNVNGDVLKIYNLLTNGDTILQRSFIYDENFNRNGYTSYNYHKVFCQAICKRNDLGDIIKVTKSYGEDQSFKKTTIYYTQVSKNKQHIKEVKSDGEITNTTIFTSFDEHGNIKKIVTQKEDHSYVQLFKIKYRK